jgi:3-deoxy-D-arabino-heptulosonate 7-phosphate (DAHP) synthase class II
MRLIKLTPIAIVASVVVSNAFANEAILNDVVVTGKVGALTQLTIEGARENVKTRLIFNIKEEIIAFFDIHKLMGTIPGGIHLEITSNDVTECLGGFQNMIDADLSKRYHTHCDPRLNSSQSLQIMLQLIKDVC